MRLLSAKVLSIVAGVLIVTLSVGFAVVQQPDTALQPCAVQTPRDTDLPQD